MKSIFSGNAQRKLSIVLAGGAALMLMSSFATASISTTKHNLGSTNSAGSNKLTSTGEICVFCHTPHGADSAASVPIWNRALANPASFTRYSSLGTATFDAAEAPVGSVSIACLSCHDGTQGMNVQINTPGSGTTGSLSLTGASTDGTMNLTTGVMQSSNGNLPGKGEFPRLGTDLMNDHPVSMQYGGGGVKAGSTGNVTVDPDFAQPSGSTTPAARSGTTVGQVGERVLGSGKHVWWVETGAAAGGGSGYDKYDLNLYTRNDNSGGVNVGVDQPFVECASCHDPHSNNTTFLRRNDTNIGSATCLTCHNK
jgi:predicted CXXCH cytochrome family protein